MWSQQFQKLPKYPKFKQILFRASSPSWIILPNSPTSDTIWLKCCSPVWLSLRKSLNLSSTDSSDWIILCYGGSSVYYEMLSGQKLPFPKLWQLKNVSRHFQVFSWGSGYSWLQAGSVLLPELSVIAWCIWFLMATHLYLRHCFNNCAILALVK